MFHVKRETVSSFALLAAAGVSLWMLRWGAPFEVWNREWVWLGNLIACVLAALWLWRFSAIGKKTKTE